MFGHSGRKMLKKVGNTVKFMKKELKNSVCCRLVRYHLGTVAFGSFIIALVQLIRLIMHYIESRVKVHVGGGRGN
jgi:hypothetical protein